MNDEQIKRMAEGAKISDDSKDDTLCSMLRDFYNRKMFSIVVLVWIWAIIFIGGAVYSGIRFFNTDQPRDQIMYAVIFICCFQGIGLIKIFAWQIIHRNAIKRHITQLELRIAELSEFVKTK